jgi:hypothetical protein
MPTAGLAENSLTRGAPIEGTTSRVGLSADRPDADHLRSNQTAIESPAPTR